MSDISLFEKLSDAYNKIRTITSVVVQAFPGGAFQMDTQNVRGVPLRVFKNLPASLGDYYKIWFDIHADREWLLYQDERVTFKEGARVYKSVAVELATTYGVKPGDKVGICMRNYPEFLIAFLSITSMGGVAVPLNALWKSEELEYAVRDAGCKVIIADPQRLQLCVPFYEKLGMQAILVRGEQKGDALPRVHSWSTVITAGEGKSAPKHMSHPEDEAMIMYTSGSTGFPKGVVHTHRSVGTTMKVGELSVISSPHPNGVMLMAVPLFHITALAPIGLFSIPGGTKIVMMRKWDAGQALEVIQKEKVTAFTGVPTMMRDLMEHPDFSAEKCASLKGITAGGAPVPPSQVSQMRKKSKKISSGQGYGLTETMALGTINKGVDYLKHPTSCGRPIPFVVEVAIKDPTTGEKLQDGKRGEVCLKGPMLMKCYNNKAEATQEAIDSEGFFHTGDIGKFEGGFLYILDRMKDLIIRGGENIDCSEIEAAIARHPAVREVSVFGLPDARLGEVVGAAVWCTDDVKVEDILLTASKNLAKFKVPEVENVFVHKEELPKGDTGKLDKKGLRKHYSELVEKRPIKAKL